MRKITKIADVPEPYLEIRNWEKFQEDHNGQLRENEHSPWVKVYTEKAWDELYGRLAPTERYTIDECRCQRGRTGRNLPNDVTWFCSAANITARHRGSITHALRTLYAVGFLIPTNQPFNHSRIRIKNKNKKKEQNNAVSPVDREETPQPDTPWAAPDFKPKTVPLTLPGAQPQKAAPKQKKQIGFNPRSAEPFDGWTQDNLDLVIAYWWDNPKVDPWYKEHVNTPDYFRKKFPEMAERVQHGWKPSQVKLPTFKTKRSFKPDGTEYPGGWNDGDYCPDCDATGIRRDKSFCPCTKLYLADGTEIDPIENQRRNLENLRRQGYSF